jgi:[acyl-carrier-protein] S-malonyltransferase
MSRIAFIFPGQGSQYEGMIDPIRNHNITQKFLDEFHQILGYRVEDLSEDELLPTNITQPALFTVSCIYHEILKEKGYQPFIVAGHSLGEFSALYASGFFTFKTGLQIVTIRGSLMSQINEETPGKMVAIIGLTEKIVEDTCLEANKMGIVEAVNYNSLQQTIISGEIEAVDFACQIAKQKGAKLIIPLKVSAPFHSSLMQKMAERFSIELEQIKIEPPKLPIIQNYDGQIHQNSEMIKQNLVLQLYHPVLWRQSMEELINRGVQEVIEVGPKKVLSGLLKKVNVTVVSSEDFVKTIN